MLPFAYGVPDAGFASGWSWWAIAFLVAFAVFIAIWFCFRPVY